MSVFLVARDAVGDFPAGRRGLVGWFASGWEGNWGADVPEETTEEGPGGLECAEAEHGALGGMGGWSCCGREVRLGG